MQREEQVILIMQIVQKQRRKKPKASELEILADAKTVCGLLIDSNDLEKRLWKTLFQLSLILKKLWLKEKEQRKPQKRLKKRLKRKQKEKENLKN